MPCAVKHFHQRTILTILAPSKWAHTLKHMAMHAAACCMLLKPPHCKYQPSAGRYNCGWKCDQELVAEHPVDTSTRGTGKFHGALGMCPAATLLHGKRKLQHSQANTWPENSFQSPEGAMHSIPFPDARASCVSLDDCVVGHLRACKGRQEKAFRNKIMCMGGDSNRCLESSCDRRKQAGGRCFLADGLN
eukprot:scaffold28994_cov20-Tisochrysis_lutea.AAC.1